MKLRKLRTAFQRLDTKARGSFMMNRIDVLSVNRRRHGTYNVAESSRRQATIKYSIPTSEGSLLICKASFLRLFMVLNCYIEDLVKRKKVGDLSYVDGRGKNQKSQEHRRKYTKRHRNAVIMHVMRFPREQSHYSRKETLENF